MYQYEPYGNILRREKNAPRHLHQSQNSFDIFKLSIIAPKSEWLYHLKLNMYLRISKYFARLQK